MGSTCSTIEDKYSWCCFRIKDGDEKKYEYCNICKRPLVGDSCSIINFCSECKIFDEYDKDGNYIYNLRPMMY